MMECNCTLPAEKYIEMSGKSIPLQGICSHSHKKKMYICVHWSIFNSKQGKIQLKEGWIYSSINKMEHYIGMKTNETELHVSRNRYIVLYTIRKWILLYINVKI